MLVKVCGMRNPENILEVAALKPNLMGFIFYPESKRFVGIDFSDSIVKSVNPDIKKVGVFVNENLEVLLSITAKYKFEYVQLHGTESPEYCKEVLKKGTKVIKAFGIHENFEWDALNPYQGVCHYFLFDTSTKGYGGSGVKFNWELLSNYTLETPFLLSGGIGPDDAQEINQMQMDQFAGVDLNSKFELEPGLKDIPKLQFFLQQITR